MAADSCVCPAVATRGEIVPSFSSPSQNCGMTILSTPLGAADLSARFLDALMNLLREEIPRRRREPVVTREEVRFLYSPSAPCRCSPCEQKLLARAA